jgi:diguanylate cyclase (GGDEF)-like protein/PAS domain S-box-containing protein
MNSVGLRIVNPITRAFGTLRRWWDHSIARRITTSALALTLAIGAAIGCGSYLVGHKLLKDAISRELANEAALAARQFESKLNILYSDLSRTSSNGILVRALADPAMREAYLDLFFQNYSGPLRLPAALTLHDALGRPITGTGNGTLPSYEGAFWLQRVVKFGFTYTEITKDGKARELLIARPVPSPAAGTNEGMLVMRIPLDALFRNAMSSYASELNRRLKTDRGEILAEINSRTLLEPIGAAQKVELDVAPFPGRVQVEVTGERAEITAPLKWLAAGYSVTALLILLVLLRVTRGLGPRLTLGLARLTEAASFIAAGNTASPQLPVKGQDEIARLTAAFNAMTGSVNELHRELESRVVERTGTLQDINSVLVKEILSHKKTGEQLHVAANAIENAAEGVMICDADERIVSVNKAFTRITGYDPEEVLGKIPDALIADEQASSLRFEISKTVLEQGHWKGELWSRNKKGDSYLEERSVSAVKDAGGRIVNYIILFSDVTKQKEDERRLQFLAHHDSLTGLANRTMFQLRCEETLLRASRKSAKAAVMFIDLDHFKTVNDSLGHAYGDDLLRGVAARVQECVRKTDFVARLGGDEFTVLLNEVTDSGDVALIAKKILDRLSACFTIAGHEIYVSASIGISYYPDDGQNAASLIKNADAAMYAAKEQGRSNYQFFSAEMNAQALEALMMASSLRLAIERDELVLEYQPRIDLGDGAVKGVEALVRWNHPNLGRIMPGQFIGIAEKTGLIDSIGHWVLRTACEQMIAWQRSGLSPLRVAVNLSARQFRQPELTEGVAAILQDTGLVAEALELEVTESLVMHDPQRAAVILERLKEMGVAIAIDDFGTGYSSLSYLKRFPIDFIKIDQSFIRGIPLEAEDVGITRAIIAMAKTLGVRLIAEGVDNYEQLAFLKKEGCDEVQGYLISRPIPGNAMRRFLETFAETGAALPLFEQRAAL